MVSEDLNFQTSENEKLQEQLVSVEVKYLYTYTDGVKHVFYLTVSKILCKDPKL